MEKTQGVIILSLRKPSYSMGAFNLALSIKHYNPNINITLVSDNEHQKHYRPEHYTVFDSIKTISVHDYIDKGVFQPALAKIRISKYSHYDKTMYIDADSLVLQDLQPLFDKLDGSSFKSAVLEGYEQWTSPEYFKEFFGFEFGKTINSSWFYFESADVFEQADAYYKKGFDYEKLTQKWGLNSYPDEMFFNASIQALKIDPSVPFDVMFFGGVIDSLTLTQRQEKYYALTLYGGAKTVRLVYVEDYNRLCFTFCTAKGIEHRFKSDQILKGKHVTNK